jgi:hypothetical protein
MLSDPDGNAPPFLYTNLNGIKAHNVFSGYARGRGLEANSPLSNLFKGLTNSGNRPDAFNPTTGAVYELKPISRSRDSAKVAKDRAQVEGYVSEINQAGSYAYAGDSTDLAPDVPGGTTIGQITDELGNENNVNIYPSDTDGLIYYALQPTGRNEVVEGVKDVAEGVARNGPFAPSRWIIQPPDPEAQ